MHDYKTTLITGNFEKISSVQQQLLSTEQDETQFFAIETNRQPQGTKMALSLRKELPENLIQKPFSGSVTKPKGFQGPKD